MAAPKFLTHEGHRETNTHPSKAQCLVFSCGAKCMLPSRAQTKLLDCPVLVWSTITEPSFCKLDHWSAATARQKKSDGTCTLMVRPIAAEHPIGFRRLHRQHRMITSCCCTDGLRCKHILHVAKIAREFHLTSPTPSNYCPLSPACDVHFRSWLVRHWNMHHVLWMPHLAQYNFCYLFWLASCYSDLYSLENFLAYSQLPMRR